MKIRVEAHFFDCGDRAVYSALRLLFELAELKKHELDVDDPERIFASEFFRVARAEMDRVEWEELIGRVASDHPFESLEEGTRRRVAVVSRDGVGLPAGAVSIPTAALRRWLEQPLRVLLENQHDAVLVQLAALLATSDRLSLALRDGWIELDGCGGSGEVKNAVERIEPLQRAFILIDSDREEPDGEHSTTAQKISDASAARRLPVHVLERRELENYVPDEVWQLTVGRIRRSRNKRKNVNARSVRVHRWLVGQVERHRTTLEARHSKRAVDNVVAMLRREAGKEVSDRSLHAALDEWRRMPPAARNVDDLKVRFGDTLAEAAIQKMSSNDFDAGWLDEDAKRELEAIAGKIEEVL